MKVNLLFGLIVMNSLACWSPARAGDLPDDALFESRVLPRLRTFHSSLALARLDPIRPPLTARYHQEAGRECSQSYQESGGKRYCYGLEQTLSPLIAVNRGAILRYELALAHSIGKGRNVMLELQEFLEEEKSFAGYTGRERSQLNRWALQAGAVSVGSLALERPMIDALERSNDQLRSADSENVGISRIFLDNLDALFARSLHDKMASIQEMMDGIQPMSAPARANGPVRFQIIAKEEADIAGILQAAAPLADLNPYGRKIAKPGEAANSPAKRQIEAWALSAGIKDPGAVVLNGDGSLSELLSVEDAKNAGVVEGAFVDAAGH